MTSLALRLMNICDKSRFPTLQAIDENIVQQLTVYQKLLLLRELVVNSLNRFVRDRSCVDRHAEYQKTLELYSKRLAELSQNYDRLSRRVMQLAQDLKSTAGEQPEGKKTEEQPLRRRPRPAGDNWAGETFLRFERESLLTVARSVENSPESGSGARSRIRRDAPTLRCRALLSKAWLHNSTDYPTWPTRTTKPHQITDCRDLPHDELGISLRYPAGGRRIPQDGRGK